MKTYGRKSLGKVCYEDTSLNFDLICRLCLTEDGEMKDLFEEEDTSEVPFPLQIMGSVSLAVYENDGLPMQICQKCSEQVEVLYKFKQKCEESDLRLRKIRNSLRNKMLAEEYDDSPKRIKVEMSENNDNSESEDDVSRKDTHQLKQHEMQSKIRDSMADLLPRPLPKAAEKSSFSTSLTEKTASSSVPSEPPIQCDIVIDLPTQAEDSAEDVTETIIGFNTIPVATEVEVSQLHFEDNQDLTEGNIQVQLFEDGEEESGGKGKTIIVNIKSDTMGLRSQHQRKPLHVPEVKQVPVKRNEGFGFVEEEEEILLRPFVCQLCPKSFVKRIDLRRHMSVHQERKGLDKDNAGFDCPTCDKWFPNQTTLRRHERSHTGERPYACHHCDKRFSQAGILQRHIMTHTGVKPYVCEVCNKGFTQREGLKVHIRSHQPRSHLDVIELHECPLCDKSFCHPSGLSRHLLVHTGRTFKCNICQKSFSDPSSLRRHTRRHDDPEATFRKK